MGDDAVDEDKIILCCALCCANCGLYNSCDCAGCSGKVGVLCLNCEVCLKFGAPCLPCCCCGPKCECDGCSVLNVQVHGLCGVVSAAIPCNEEVPLAVNVLGCNLYPKCGCCVTIGEIKAEGMCR
ncbi:expressed unknown protein [Seminavis robusta]|uniref:Uncharacterized protein n=1 Tax=Seminavis robusta TaxID=568900 RepID=A0A9N8E416_9STRA|nr:expressed unknown protein [Seminavis robusta]|eukprot:Sro598_g172960.1 n/a (125) ;mRNA; r:8653-9223